MNIYKLVLDGGLVYPSIYKRLNFNSNITTASGLKSLLKRLRGSVQKDASFFISVGAEGKPDAVFVISYGFTNNAVFCKELLTAGILCQSSNFLIVLFIEKEEDFLEEIAKQDFSQVTKAFDLLELNLKGYYVRAGTTIHLIKE